MAKGRGVSYPRRGEVYLVRFDPTFGAEIKKTRPALVIQNDIGNKEAATTIVAAITSKFGSHLYPIEVLVRAGEGGLGVDSVVRLDQIRSVDKRRLVRCLGRVGPATIDQVNRSIALSLDLARE